MADPASPNRHVNRPSPPAPSDISTNHTAPGHSARHTPGPGPPISGDSRASDRVTGGSRPAVHKGPVDPAEASSRGYLLKLSSQVKITQDERRYSSSSDRSRSRSPPPPPPSSRAAIIGATSGIPYEVVCCACKTNNIGCLSCGGCVFKLQGPIYEQKIRGGEVSPEATRYDDLEACEECGARNDLAFTACQICGHLSTSSTQKEVDYLRRRLQASHEQALELQRQLAEKSAEVQRLQMLETLTKEKEAKRERSKENAGEWTNILGFPT
eukprot:CAMPEP_0181290174 /NCGR_PEP_ID=MMETSP1101-20121128/1277_1 /TAXON_ID=46948 /ORGANISM="Rhodomonas abbreviata, Strain Caron Lab Isolate" /LENGTH=268 /DNA_ID=CAMNT_0023394449 /DNA_START=196 /DNA_END=1002 /DNA_ORIENTATION=+